MLLGIKKSIPGCGSTGDNCACSSLGSGIAINSGDFGCAWSPAALSDCTSDGELASGVSVSATFLRVLAFLLHRGRSSRWFTSVK